MDDTSPWSPSAVRAALDAWEVHGQAGDSPEECMRAALTAALTDTRPDENGVHTWPTAFSANAVDPGDMEAHHWTVKAEWRGPYGWAVTDGTFCLSVVDGVAEWDYEPIPSEREEEFYARTRFPMLDAIRWAQVMAGRRTINGYTVEDGRRMAAKRRERRERPDG